MLDKWYWIMPNIVLFDKELTDKQKLLFCLISSLCAKEWFCWATNEMLGNKLNASKITISKNVAALCDRWFISIEVSQKDGNTRKITIVKNDKRYSQKWQEGIVKNDNPLYIYNITNEYLYERYYWSTKWINKKKCNGIIDDLLKQWITLDDIRIWMVLYNNECRLSKEWRYVRKLENWLAEFQPLTDEQIEENLTRIVREYKQKKKSDEKYSKSKPCKDLWNELSEVFWKEKVNAIYKSESTGGIKLNFT